MRRVFQPIVVLATVPILAFAGFAGEPAAAAPGAPFPLHPLLRGPAPPPPSGEALRLVHMTDTHVVADGTILNGVDR